MSNQLKRINLSLFLDTVDSDADRFAVGVLKNWYGRAQKVHAAQHGVFDFTKSRFHRDVYLSGMYLYLLAPGLSQTLANTLGNDRVNINTLKHVFAANGFVLDHHSPAAAPTAATQASAPAAAVTLDHEALVSDIMSRMAEQHRPDTDLLEELKSSLDNLDQRTGQADINSDELADALAERLPLKPHHGADIEGLISGLARQISEQTRLIQEQSRIINRLASGATLVARGAEATGDSSQAAPVVEDLSSQLANVKKARGKGLF